MFSSVWVAIVLGGISLGLFVYSLVKHENRLQSIEQQIATKQEKFINK